jgi:putative phosphoribosyl transferase
MGTHPLPHLFKTQPAPAVWASSLPDRTTVCFGEDYLPFENRTSAGRLLALQLAVLHKPTEPLVVAMSPGAAVVARPIAELLSAPLDIIFVQNVRVPWEPETVLATADSEGGRTVYDAAARRLQLSPHFVYGLIGRTANDLTTRVNACRYGRPERARREMILVDDGEADLLQIKAALATLHKQGPRDILFASPFTTLDSADAIASRVDYSLLLALSDPIQPPSTYYRSFARVTDEEVAAILRPKKPVRSLTTPRVVGAA